NLEKYKSLEENKLKLQQLKKEESLRKKFWFEKYKWFISSDGFLMIACKDDTSNEDIIKDHLEEHDIVFHTEAPSSPFVVIKNPTKTKIPNSTIQETAIYAGSQSKAWSLGISSTEVFYVNPNQISKTPKSGEYITKGSFIINGKRTTIKIPMGLAVGKINYEGQELIMIAPKESFKEKPIVLKQGDMKKEELSKKL